MKILLTHKFEFTTATFWHRKPLGLGNEKKKLFKNFKYSLSHLYSKKKSFPRTERQMQHNDAITKCFRKLTGEIWGQSILFRSNKQKSPSLARFKENKTKYFRLWRYDEVFSECLLSNLWVLSECLLNALWCILKSSWRHPEVFMNSSWSHHEESEAER